MNKADLLDIITNGENSGVEFKRDDIRPEQLAKEVVAMANFQGGMVLIGVDNDGTIAGIQKNNLEARKQQMRLFELGGMLHTEVLPVPRTDLNSLDEARLTNYVRDILRDPEVPASTQDWQQRLLGLGLMTEVGDQVCCTIAGLVLFGKKPRAFLKQAGIRVMAFQGVDKHYQALLDEILDGPMVGRWDITGSSKTLLDAGIIERFMTAMKPFISQQGGTIDENLRRDTTWFYPIEAIREAVINALAHRDWTRFIDIEINHYADRLEIISPGTLPNSMTIEKMKAGQRSPRNTIIMEILRDYGYVDHRGMGVRTKIVPLTKALTGKDPEFLVTDDYLKTTLFR